MIWGCQYEKLLFWLLEKDKLNNIYDLLGCNKELTLEGYYEQSRVFRSGSRDSSGVQSTNGLYYRHEKGLLGTYFSAFHSSRIVLYVK